MKAAALVSISLALFAAGSTALNEAALSAEAEEVKAETSETVEDGEGTTTEVLPAKRSYSFKPKPEGRHQPWHIVRSLQRHQDNIALGGELAVRKYKVLLRQSSKWMEKLPASAWQFERNLDALAIYLLIGGNVELGYKALQYTKLEEHQKTRLRAAIAYNERDGGLTIRLMNQFDHRLLPPSFAGQFALAKAMAYSSADLDLSARYLDEVRLLAPGTLTEEASLRRALRVAAERNDIDTVRFLLRTYMNRFRKSHYFNDYLRNVSYGLTSVADETGKNIIPDFEFLLKNIPEEMGVKVTEYVARNAAMTNRFPLAIWASNYTLKRVEQDSKIYTRVRLYRAASLVVNPDETETARMTLQDLDSTHLAKQDRKIAEAIEEISELILSDGKENEAGMMPKDILEEPFSEEAETTAAPETEPEAKLSQEDRFSELNSKLEKIINGETE